MCMYSHGHYSIVRFISYMYIEKGATRRTGIHCKTNNANVFAQLLYGRWPPSGFGLDDILRLKMFKDAFKYYKQRKPPPDFQNVIDIRTSNNFSVKEINIDFREPNIEEEQGLKHLECWKIYESTNIPGLIFIENPFTKIGQQEWIIRCLKDYAKKPNKLNIDAHDFLKNDESWWDACFRNGEKQTDLESKLRWATLGYHHNWDTKQYSENEKTKMSNSLAKLTQYFAKILDFKNFVAEAAIVNYYRMNSTLAGHTDHSERCLEAPLFSISFGQTAIFLIGGTSPDDPADAIFLRSGDVVVMSDSARLRYHGVPKILADDSSPWDLENQSLNEDWKKAKSYILNARINLNVRQVLKAGDISL